MRAGEVSYYGWMLGTFGVFLSTPAELPVFTVNILLTNTKVVRIAYLIAIWIHISVCKKKLIQNFLLDPRRTPYVNCCTLLLWHNELKAHTQLCDVINLRLHLGSLRVFCERSPVCFMLHAAVTIFSTLLGTLACLPLVARGCDRSGRTTISHLRFIINVVLTSVGWLLCGRLWTSVRDFGGWMTTALNYWSNVLLGAWPRSYGELQFVQCHRCFVYRPFDTAVIQCFDTYCGACYILISQIIFFSCDILLCRSNLWFLFLSHNLSCLKLSFLVNLIFVNWLISYIVYWFEVLIYV